MDLQALPGDFSPLSAKKKNPQKADDYGSTLMRSEMEPIEWRLFPNLQNAGTPCLIWFWQKPTEREFIFSIPIMER